MADVCGKEKRSFTMSKIRKTNTKPELIVRQFLFKRGFRYRVHVKGLSGCPDIVLRKYNTVIFVNGCFWHAHEGCHLNRMPKSRQEYWVPKILRNALRDRQNKLLLETLKWKVITVWECDLSKQKMDKRLETLIEEINGKKTLYS